MLMKAGDFVLCTTDFLNESENNSQFNGRCQISSVYDYGYDIKKEGITDLVFCDFDEVIPYSEMWEGYQRVGIDIVTGLNEPEE